MKLKVLIFLFIILSITVAFSPIFLSTPAGNRFIEANLRQQTTGKFSLGKAKFYWTGGQVIENTSWSQGAATVHVQKLTFQSPLLQILTSRPYIGTIAIEGLSLKFNQDAKSPGHLLQGISGKIELERDKIEIKLDGYVLENQQASPFSIQTTLDGYDLFNRGFLSAKKIDAKVHDVPSEALVLLSQNLIPKLASIVPEILGGRVSLSIDEELSNEGMLFNLKAHSPTLNAHFQGVLDGDKMFLKEPGLFELKDKRIVVNVDSLEVPLERPEDSKLSISIHDLPTFWIEKIIPDSQASTIFGQSLNISATADPKEQTLEIALNSEKVQLPELDIRFEEAAELPQKIIFKFKGKTGGNGTFGGMVAWEEGSLAVNLQANSLPGRYFPKEIHGSFGEAIDVNLSAKLVDEAGFIKADLKGPLGFCKLDGRFERGGLFLNQPFYAEIQGSSSFGTLVLADISPLLATLRASETPISLTIDNNDFYLPIQPFNPLALQIKAGRIDLGKMTFANSGELSEALKVLRPGSEETINAWATPLYFSVNSGIVKIPRFDFLVMDRYPMASWGKIDLSKQYVDMVVGISGYAVNQAFNLGLSDTRFMLQMPLKGPIDNVKLDAKKATAKLTAMSAKAHGSPTGLVLGTLLDVANGIFLRQDKVPAPTTSPLPWTEKTEEVPMPANEPEEIPVAELESAAKSLFKKIFK